MFALEFNTAKSRAYQYSALHLLFNYRQAHFVYCPTSPLWLVWREVGGGFHGDGSGSLRGQEGPSQTQTDSEEV